MQSGALVVFNSGDYRFALKRAAVSRLAAAPRLAGAPDAPPALAGYFDYGTELVSVLRFAVLLGHGEAYPPRLYDHLILLRSAAPRIALLVDRVDGVLDPPRGDVRAVSPGHSHRDCLVAEISNRGAPILLLDSARVIAEYEQDRVKHFEAVERRRRRVFEAVQ